MVQRLNHGRRATYFLFSPSTFACVRTIWSCNSLGDLHAESLSNVNHAPTSRKPERMKGMKVLTRMR